MLHVDKSTGLVNEATWRPSLNCDDRPRDCEPEAIILHSISLPPGRYSDGSRISLKGSEYEGFDEEPKSSPNQEQEYISAFFTNHLQIDAHDYFKRVENVRVSAHFCVLRTGHIVQYVATHHRAWHAGDSFCLQRSDVNDFSIGIELEGLDCDVNGFENRQYTQTAALIDILLETYPSIVPHHLFAHSDIAPGRKADPGPYFDWQRLVEQMQTPI